MATKVMGSLPSLRPLTRGALADISDIASDDLWVLTYPEGELELGQTPQGEYVLWAYSHFQLLIESCGVAQPAVRATPAQLDEFADAAGIATLVALDVWHPEGARYPEPDASEREPLAELRAPTPQPLELVWIPTRPITVGDRVVQAELHTDEARQLVLPVFTSVQAMRESCGPHQAAGGIYAQDIRAVAGALEVDVVFDPLLDESARHTGPIQDWVRKNHFG